MSETAKKILVSDFVKGYKQLTNEDLKDKYVKKHITTTYAPILRKKLILEVMNEKSVIDDDDTGKYIDMTTSKLNLIMAVLALYTDIEPDKNKDGQPLVCDSYDDLQSTGLIGKILQEIGSDIEELMSVQSDVMDTWHLKNKSTEAYISYLVDYATHKFGVVAGAGMEKLAEVLEDEKKMNKVVVAFDKVLKKIK